MSFPWGIKLSVSHHYIRLLLLTLSNISMLSFTEVCDDVDIVSICISIVDCYAFIILFFSFFSAAHITWELPIKNLLAGRLAEFKKKVSTAFAAWIKRKGGWCGGGNNRWRRGACKLRRKRQWGGKKSEKRSDKTFVKKKNPNWDYW